MGCGATRGIAALGESGGLGLGERTGHAAAFGAWRGQVEVELGPLRARDRPLFLVAEMIRAVAGADGELHRRLLHHAIVDVLEPVVEEAQLVVPPIVAVERMIMRAAMDAQLFMFRGGAHVALGGPAQVQSHARPVADRPHRNIDLVPLRLLVLERTAVQTVAHEAPEHVVLKRVGIVLVGAPQQVVRHMGGEPADNETRAENAAVIKNVAVLIGSAFPRHDAGERWRLEVRHPPLGACEERDADGGDAAVAPRLMPRPFDRIVEVDRLLR